MIIIANIIWVFMSKKCVFMNSTNNIKIQYNKYKKKYIYIYNKCNHNV